MPKTVSYGSIYRLTRSRRRTLTQLSNKSFNQSPATRRERLAACTKEDETVGRFYRRKPHPYRATTATHSSASRGQTNAVISASWKRWRLSLLQDDWFIQLKAARMPGNSGCVGNRIGVSAAVRVEWRLRIRNSRRFGLTHPSPAQLRGMEQSWNRSRFSARLARALFECAIRK